MIAAGGLKTDHKHFCSTSLEPTFWGQQKSNQIKNIKIAGYLLGVIQLFCKAVIAKLL